MGSQSVVSRFESGVYRAVCNMSATVSEVLGLCLVLSCAANHFEERISCCSQPYDGQLVNVDSPLVIFARLARALIVSLAVCSVPSGSVLSV